MLIALPFKGEPPELPDHAQLALLQDDKRSAKVQLRGGTSLRLDKLEARLCIGEGTKFPAPLSASVTDSDKTFTATFPSLLKSQLAKADDTLKAFQARSGILVSTIHGVKGAEFDVVIAHTLLDGMVPHLNDAGGDDSAKKLLYVIGSWARMHLHMFSETGRARGQRGDMWGPTRLLTAYAFPYDAP